MIAALAEDRDGAREALITVVRRARGRARAGARVPAAAGFGVVLRHGRARRWCLTCTARIRDWWDADARRYDRSVGHAISIPVEAAAWSAALRRFLRRRPRACWTWGPGPARSPCSPPSLVTRSPRSTSPKGCSTARAARRRSAVRRSHSCVGAAEAPPDGPFDAVIERHVAWTLPDPVAAFSAWRAVAPTGRVVLFEGSWGGEGPLVKVKDGIVALIHRIRGDVDDHHAAVPGGRGAPPPAGGDHDAGAIRRRCARGRVARGAARATPRR